jgi:hypothetical protein
LRFGQRFAFAAEKYHEVGHAAVINVGVRPARAEGWIGREVLRFVFVDECLQVDAHPAVGANHFVGANAGVGRNVAMGVRNLDVSGIVANGVLRALDGSGDEFVEEFLMRGGIARLSLGQGHAKRQRERGSMCEERTGQSDACSHGFYRNSRCVVAGAQLP